MRKTIIIYGFAMAALVGLLKLVEYKYLIRDIPLEFYIGLVALLFTALGIWAGLRLTRRRVIEISAPFEVNETNLQKLGISKREYDYIEAGGALVRGLLAGERTAFPWALALERRMHPAPPVGERA